MEVPLGQLLHLISLYNLPRLFRLTEETIPLLNFSKYAANKISELTSFVRQGSTLLNPARWQGLSAFWQII